MSKKSTKLGLKMGLGIGGPSIIMVFVVLCLTTLGSLAVVTANADYKLTTKYGETVKAYYQADGEAEEKLAEIHEDLAAGQPLATDSFEIPMTDRQKLVVTIEAVGSGYKVLSHRLETIGNWNYDQFEEQFDSTLPQ